MPGNAAGKNAGTAPLRPTFGARVAIVDRLLGGAISRTDACRRLSITEVELDEWVHAHARDRPVSLDEFRIPSTLGAGMHDHWRHLRQLESLLRARHRELLMLQRIARGRGLI